MIKRSISLLMVVFLLLGLCACDIDELIPSENKDITTSDIEIQDSESSRTFTIKDYNVSFTVPTDWQVDMEDTELDIFCTNGDVHMGVYGYFTADFADTTDHSKLWEQQNEADLERFDNVEKFDHQPQFESTDKELKADLYSFEYQNLKEIIYYVYAKPVEDADVFLWISFSGLTSDVRKNFDVIEDIVDSIEFKQIDM